MTITRTIRVELRSSTWSPKTPHSGLIALNGTQVLDILEVLLHVAISTAPPVAYGFELSQFWPWLRYLPALTEGPGLRLRPEWTDLDSHQKTVLSDDFGMGASTWLLSRALDLTAFAPTNYVVGRVGPPWLYLEKSGKCGPSKSPDFIGLDGHGTLHAIESKGTQTFGNLDRQLTTGKPQKRNLVVGAPYTLGESVVAGIFIPQSNAKEDALCRIIDPPVVQEGGVTGSPRESVPLALARANVSSTLHLLGLPAEANAIATGEEATTRLTPAQMKRLHEEQPWPDRPAYKGIQRTVRFPRSAGGVGGTAEGVRAYVALESELLQDIARGRGREALERLADRAKKQRPNRRSKEGRADLETPTGTYAAIEKLDSE